MKPTIKLMLPSCTFGVHDDHFTSTKFLCGKKRRVEIQVSKKKFHTNIHKLG